MTTLAALARHPSTREHVDSSFHESWPLPTPPATRPLQVAFLNNMPDGAFCTTERQFGRLLQSAGIDIRMRRYTLSGIPRKPAFHDYIREHYSSLDELWDSAPDALVVTGVNPHTSMLSEERFWRELCGVLSWGVTHTSSLIVSCLAAHAALLHFAGVRRRPSERKLSGVFQQNVVPGDRLTAALPPSVIVPHSRKNDVPREIVEAVGYNVLIGARQDLWTLATTEMSGCLVVAIQGHPEYDAHTLLLEYRRDVQQFQSGLRDDHPDIPVGYLDPTAVELLARYREQCVAARRTGTLSSAFPYDDLMGRVTSPWKATARVLYKNWVDEVCRRSELPTTRG